MTEQLKLSNVDFRGQSNDVEGIWAEHHALVLPSRFEGMPLVVVEAMLCGRPCIVTDVGGNRELVRDGINGFMAKAPTVELLDEAMNRAWESRGRLKEMGRVAAQDVRQFVSRDPGEDFARELAALAGDTNSAAAFAANAAALRNAVETNLWHEGFQHFVDRYKADNQFVHYWDFIRGRELAGFAATANSPALATPFFLTVTTQLSSAGNSCAVWFRLN